jgi:hypothetical protein
MRGKRRWDYDDDERWEAEQATEIASTVLEELFPQVIDGIGLRIDRRLRIVDK